MTPCSKDPARWKDARQPDVEAQRLCRTVCSIREVCLEQALIGSNDGIWGGVFIAENTRHSRLHNHGVDKVRHTLAVLTGEQVA